MAESEKDFLWTIKLDWLNIVNMLDLSNINQIAEFKKMKAIRKITKIYGSEKLMDFEPEYLDNLVITELKELMKKELSINARKQEERERELRSKVMKFGKGGIIKLDHRDLKDFNGDESELLKYLKKFLGGDDDDKDEDKDKYKEDNTGYYI
ncbi:MAG: hypothetical protein ACFFA0_07915 [Promethearchaeota archaeon]